MIKYSIVTKFVPQRDKDGFLLPGGPYAGCNIHGHSTDDNA